MHSHLETLVIIVLLFQSITEGHSEKRCEGGDASKIPDNCVIIHKSKIIFTGHKFEDAIFDKLSSVLKIEKGVEVVETTIENFDYLNQVREIKNPDGPALTFKNNKNLKRITMDNLKMLSGKKEDVLFEKDNFPIAAYEGSQALNDLLRLEAAARSYHDREKCSEEFIKIIPIETTGYGWLLYLLISICVIMSVIIVYQTVRFLKAKGIIGKKKSENKKVESGKKTSVKGKDEKNTSSENTSRKSNSKSSGKEVSKKK